MWKEILSHVYDRRDIKSLALTCKLSHGVAMERLYHYISCPTGKGLDSTGVKSLSRLIRTLSCSDFPRLVQGMQLIWTTHPDESALLSALLNLTASSVKELKLSGIPKTSEDLAALLLLYPTMPLLRKLHISDLAVGEEHGSAQILKHLPALRHLALDYYQLPHSKILGQFVGSVSSLTTLSIYIRNRSYRVSNSHDDQVVPFRLAEAFEPLKHRLKDLRFYYLSDTAQPVARGCLLCKVGSLKDFTSMRRLVLPLDRLSCNKAFATSPGSMCQPIPAVKCLPLSLQELWLQLSVDWAIDLDSADTEAWRAYENGETIEPPPISDDQTLPLFATIRAVLEQIHHCLPELRTVVLWGWTPLWNIYIPEAKFKAVFKKLIPSEQELQAWKIRLVLSPGHVEPYDIYRYLDDFDEIEKSGDYLSLDD